MSLSEAPNANPTPRERATIFLAHSSQDFAQARLVRNLFEDEGHDVLLLKLSQQMDEAFLETLLKREIEARGWLVVVRSPNATSSQWVTFEQEYGQANDKPIFNVDLEACANFTGSAHYDCLRAQVMRVAKNFRVFLSYSRTDALAVQRVHDDLKARGYEVWFDFNEIEPGTDFVSTIHKAIDETLARGALVYLASPASLISDFARHELQYALSKEGKVIPCLLAGGPGVVPLELAAVQWADFRSSYADGFAGLIAGLEQADADGSAMAAAGVAEGSRR
jgi:TIR domain